MYYILKLLISAGLIVAISEVGKRSSAMGAILASLPLTSLLAFVWMYIDTKDVKPIADLSVDILWLVIPSLTFFIIFPYMLRKGINFWISMGGSALVTIVCYFLFLAIMKK